MRARTPSRTIRLSSARKTLIVPGGPASRWSIYPVVAHPGGDPPVGRHAEIRWWWHTGCHGPAPWRPGRAVPTLASCARTRLAAGQAAEQVRAILRLVAHELWTRWRIWAVLVL